MSTDLLEQTEADEMPPLELPEIDLGPPPAAIPVVLGPKMRNIDVPIVAGFMPVKVLIPNFEVPYRIHATKEGYQRLPQDSRVNELASDLMKKRVDLPTSILLNVRNRESRKAYANGRLDLSFLTDPARAGGRFPTNKFYVVDGQHRVLALRRVVSMKGGEEWREFMVPFVCMLGATEEEEMEQFHVVNSKAKSVRTDLAYELLAQRGQHDKDVMDALIERGQEWQIKAQLLVERLATESPVWRGRIRFAAMEKEHTIMPSASMVTSLKPLLSSPFFKMMTPDRQVQIVDAFWRGLRSIMPDAFDEPSEFALQKGVGVIVLHNILVSVLELVKASGYSIVEPESYERILREGLQSLQGDDANGNPVQGEDFWRVAPKGAAGSYSSSAGRRVLIAKIQQLLPEMDVE